MLGTSSINGVLPVLDRHRGAIIVYKERRLAKTRALSSTADIHTHTHTHLFRALFSLGHFDTNNINTYTYLYIYIYIHTINMYSVRRDSSLGFRSAHDCPSRYK